MCVGAAAPVETVETEGEFSAALRAKKGEKGTCSPVALEQPRSSLDLARSRAGSGSTGALWLGLRARRWTSGGASRRVTRPPSCLRRGSRRSCGTLRDCPTRRAKSTSRCDWQAASSRSGTRARSSSSSTSSATARFSRYALSLARSKVPSPPERATGLNLAIYQHRAPGNRPPLGRARVQVMASRAQYGSGTESAEDAAAFAAATAALHRGDIVGTVTGHARGNRAGRLGGGLGRGLWSLEDGPACSLATRPQASGAFRPSRVAAS